MTEPSHGGALARRILDDLAQATADPPGVTRVSYGAGEQYAHDLVRREGEALGAVSRVDAAGNLYLTRRGANAELPALFIGSHLDSVAHGGNFDGAAGVVAGLAALADLAAQGIETERDITVMVTRAEEAVWFPLSYPGTQAALGLLSAADLEVRRVDTGRTLADHMTEAGLDPEAVRKGTAQIDPDRIRGFVEVHIEQGPRLISLDRPIAIVTATNGGFRHLDARCLGLYAHSGAEPRFSRRDAVLGFSDLVQGLEAVWDRLEAEGDQATISFGRVESDPAQHGGSRVLGELGFTIDVRSEHQRILDSIAAAITGLCAEIEERRGVRFDLGPTLTWDPTPMDGELMERLASAAEGIGLDAPRMSSGGGHDAAAFAAAGIPSAMVFVRNANGSHNPDESMEMADLDEAIRLLVEFVTRLDKTGDTTGASG